MATTAATGKQAQAVHGTSHHACRCKQAVLHGQRRLRLGTLPTQCAVARICTTRQKGTLGFEKLLIFRVSRACCWKRRCLRRCMASVGCMTSLSQRAWMPSPRILATSASAVCRLHAAPHTRRRSATLFCICASAKERLSKHRAQWQLR